MKKSILIVIITIIVLLLFGSAYIIQAGKTEIKIENIDNINNPFILGDVENNEDKIKKYAKIIDGVIIELGIPKDWNYEEIEETKNPNIKFALNIYKNSKENSALLYLSNNMFGVCGTNLTRKRITLDNGIEANVGYYGGNEDWNFISFYEMNPNIAFINKGLDSDEAKEVLEFVKTINISNELVETDTTIIRSFYGKVIESHEKYIVVEPNDGEDIKKSADKISISLDENNDAIYAVGTNVKVTYDGEVMETYPAQIKVRNIELKSAEEFEILFYDKLPQEMSNKIYKILDKSETDKYDYTIYGYNGSINIRIDGKDYSLKEALRGNKITMEEIISKANQDLNDKKITGDMYKDGGSMEYHYENYTIIKCHTLDGNRDVYIGTKDMTLNDVL